jgi:hypothetical protein
MEPAEIIYRIIERARQVWSKGRDEGWQHYASTGQAPDLPGLREYLISLARVDPRALANTVFDILDGKFSALGQAWPKRQPDALFPEALWRFDPVTRQLWPGIETYCFDISYRHETTLGDIKYVWDVNRLQFLQPLALRARFDQDKPSLDAIEICIASWHAANPPFRGVAWNSGIEIALRAISLLAVSSLIGPQLSPSTVQKLRTILAASLYWLRRFPSRYSSANNHLIAEATGEYLIALALPDLAGAGESILSARSTLEVEALKQFLEDGTPAEQSPTYGAFSAELLHTAHCASPLDVSVHHRLQSFSDFIFALDDGSGKLPNIGDDDEGLVLVNGSRPHDYAREISTRLCSPHTPTGMKTFPQGGYTIFNDEQWHLVFDHGPLGYLSIAAHGHADALALTLSLNGRQILVDPGTYLYHSGGNWRDWFRGTPAHNTLSISGANQSRIAGPFNWLEKAVAGLEHAQDGPAWKVAASHNGYIKQFGVTHRRTIEYKSDAIVICDQLIGKASATVSDIAFQLAADLNAQINDNICRISAEGHDVVEVVLPSHGTVQLFRGAPPEAGGGWVSPSFGVKVAAPRIVWSGPVETTGVTTIVRAARGKE